MRYQHEQFSRWFMEVQPLFVAHWREVARDRDCIAMNPDYHKMLLLEAAGNAHGFTARTDPGALAGYAWFVVQPHLHYRDDLCASNDIIYLKPEHRTPRAALRLIECAERVLTAKGVSRILYHIKLDHSSGGRLLAHMGYEPVETIHQKTVKRKALAEKAA